MRKLEFYPEQEQTRIEWSSRSNAACMDKRLENLLRGLGYVISESISGPESGSNGYYHSVVQPPMTHDHMKIVQDFANQVLFEGKPPEPLVIHQAADQQYPSSYAA